MLYTYLGGGVLAICLFICFASFPCAAAPNEQVFFKRTQNDENINYEYHWYDHANTLRKVMFSIDAKALSKLPQSQSHYLPEIVQNTIHRDLMQFAKTIDPRNARVNIQRKTEGIEIGIRSSDKQQIQRLKKIFKEKEDAAFTNYLDKHYFERFRAPSGQIGIKTDHVRYIAQYRALFNPVARAFYETLNNLGSPRDLINFIISWTQSIPYNELEGRGESNGAGFLPPVALMDANLGDCDSKSVLAAAIIRNVMPSTELHLVVLPKHALLAVGTTPRQDDIKVKGKYREVVVFEPTGPAPLALGEVAPSSLQAINGMQFTLQEIPSR